MSEQQAPGRDEDVEVLPFSLARLLADPEVARWLHEHDERVRAEALREAQPPGGCAPGQCILMVRAATDLDFTEVYDDEDLA